MSDLPRTADLERLMQLLMHDLRSPLGVAQGYAGLLGGDQLSAEDRARALRGVTDAISRMSRLVDDVASMLAPDEAAGRQATVEVSLLCARVATEAERRGIQITFGDRCPDENVTVGASIDRLVEAIVVVLSPGGGELGFVTPRELEAVGPESMGTVELLRAHLHISQLQGRVWRKVGESRACRVTLITEPIIK